MAHLQIERVHGLSAEQALGLTEQWVAQASGDWGMRCEAVPAYDGTQTWRFERPGVAGELRVDDERFVLDLKLGFLLSAYQHKIRQQVERNLDDAIRALS
jgi:putative polyhydroxyalkanoate system protein